SLRQAALVAGINEVAGALKARGIYPRRSLAFGSLLTPLPPRMGRAAHEPAGSRRDGARAGSARRYRERAGSWRTAVRSRSARGVATAPRRGRAAFRAPRPLTAGVRARRGGAFFLLRQLRSREGGAVEDVPLADLQDVQPEERKRLSRNHCSADDHRRAVRVEWTHLPALVDRHRGEAL